VFVNSIRFRRHGHNEGDEPSYTQPVYVSANSRTSGVRTNLARKLVKEGIYTQEEIDALNEERNRRYENAYSGCERDCLASTTSIDSQVVPEKAELEEIDTGVDSDNLQTIRARGYHCTQRVSSEP